VQDLGRGDFRHFGVNPNGAMDKKAVRLINILLGNDENEAVLEIHFPAPKILFEKNALIALGGANFNARIDNRKIENWRPVFIEKGQTIKFSQKVSGNRLYLSVRRGFKIKSWLESKSTNLKAKIGGFEGRNLRKDDRILFNAKCKMQSAKFPFRMANSLIPDYSVSPKIRVIAGAEWEKLNKKSESEFLSQKFSVSLNSDRMGFRLRGSPLRLSRKLELVSSAVNFGTIQLLPDGQMIMLMADHQTTGGYPRIAHIIAEDLPLAAQLGANDSLSFEIISLDEAENLVLKFDANLNLLKTAIKFPTIFNAKAQRCKDAKC